MKLYAPSYYPSFRCIAGACTHTCCQGWEVDIDEDSLKRFSTYPEITCHIITVDAAGDTPDEAPHFRLLEDERCPFLNEDGLCRMILDHGEDMLCQICTDHPRFRSYWADRIETGLGMVCEEAARLILSQKEPMSLILIGENDEEEEEMSDEELWLLDLRDSLLKDVTAQGPAARLMEYLIFRHLPNALYDDRVYERLAFIQDAHREIISLWKDTDDLTAMAQICRQWSYDVEYDEDELERRISSYEIIDTI